MNKILVLVSAAALLAGCSCSPRNVRLTVVNESTATITNAVVSGTGFSTPVGPLAPGAQQQVLLKSDTGAFQLEFDAKGRHFSEVSPKDPWNGMKEVIMTVGTNFTVSCASVTTF